MAMRTARRSTLGAVLLLAALAPPPAAAQVEPLPPPAWVLPADAASRPASAWPAATPFEMVDFTIYVYAPFLLDGEFVVEVASSPTPDPDGTLADADRIDQLVATPRPGFSGVFSVRTDLGTRWLGTPGTYYWQAYSTRSNPEAGCDPCVYASPAQSLEITARLAADPPSPDAQPPAPVVAPSGQTLVGAPSYPTAAPLTLAAARRAVRATIRLRTGRRPRGLDPGCTLATTYDARCRTVWHDARYRYRGTMFVWSDAGGTRASFTGTRARRGCKGTAHRCAARVRWTP